MKRAFSRIITIVENTPLTLASFSMAFLALIVARLTVENTLALFEERTLFFMFFEFTHTFLFFLCSYLILIHLVRFAGNTSLKQAATILLFGFLIILSPPIIDTLIFQGTHFWSFYEFDGLKGLFQRFFTLFGDTPEMGITYGVRIEVVIVTLALGAYTYLKQKDTLKSLLVAFLAYSILFILGTFPSWVTLLVLGFEKGWVAVSSSDVAALFLSPETVLARDLNDFRSVLNFKMSIIYGAFAVFLTGLLLFREFPSYFFALLRNARFPQLIYHGGLLFLGMLLAGYFSSISFTFDMFHIVGTFILLAAVESAWLASVLINDLFDTKIDALTNPNRPLIENTIPPEIYRTQAVLFFLTSLLLSGIISFRALLLMLTYQALAWLYSAEPFRLKRFPLIATLLAAAAGLAILITGYVAYSPVSNLHDVPLSLLVFLFIAYTLTLPLKDFKDIPGDAADHVYTLPVLLGETRAKYVVGGAMFLLYAASPLVLHVHSLFLPALLSGSLAFFIIQKSKKDEGSRLSFRKLPGNLLCVAITYGLVITFFLSR